MTDAQLVMKMLAYHHLISRIAFGSNLGNVFTYANTNQTKRYGQQLPRNFKPPRIQPGLLNHVYSSPASDYG